MYLGKWHSSEVAIKCLNPSLFFSGSDGTASKAAMADLLREADLLAYLRHPNVVWVYGVVLPRMVRPHLHAPHCRSSACILAMLQSRLSVERCGLCWLQSLQSPKAVHVRQQVVAPMDCQGGIVSPLVLWEEP